MKESFGAFAKRKLGNTASCFYRKLIFPFVKMGIERKTGSIVGKGSYMNKGTVLEGRNYIADDVILTNVFAGYGSMVSRGSNVSNTRIGRYTCIAGLETAIGRHPVKGENISVHPAFFSTAAQYGYTYVDETSFEEVRFVDENRKYNISIGNDVWIGRDVTVIDGVTICDGAVIGAGSLVNTDVEPYAIYAGIPAKKIGARFDDETVAALLKLRWWEKDEKWLAEHAGEFKDPDGFMEKYCK